MPPYCCMPRCAPPRGPTQILKKPVGLHLRLWSLNQPAASKPSLWDHLFSPSPKKVSDSSREIRIVAAPAHLPPLRNCPSPASRSKRATQPVALPVLCRSLLFSPISRATRRTFRVKGSSRGYPGKNGLLAQPLSFHSLLCFVYYPSIYLSFLHPRSFLEASLARQKTTSFFFLLFIVLEF